MRIKQFTVNPFGENTYIVWDETTGAGCVIDCGALFPEEEERIGQFVEREGICIKHLLNTHLHLDHSFGNHWASVRWGIRPTAHKADEPFIATMGDQCKMFGLPVEPTPQPLGTTYADGDIITMGNIDICVLHTPGHTPGGVCLYMASERTLFSGATLFDGSVGRSDLPGGSHTNLIHSINTRLMTLPPDTKVYPGHGGHTTIGYEKENNPFL